jgi:U1 small nuclear ribonucleoprotein
MTAQLPPNLLKLFTPRPPLPYVKPVGPDYDRPKVFKTQGVAALFAELKSDTASKERQRLETGLEEEGETKEESFTRTEMEKRRIKKEQKAKQREEWKKNAEASCPSPPCRISRAFSLANPSLQRLARNPSFTDKPLDDPEAVGDPYKTLFISRLVRVARRRPACLVEPNADLESADGLILPPAVPPVQEGDRAGPSARV